MIGKSENSSHHQFKSSLTAGTGTGTMVAGPLKQQILLNPTNNNSNNVKAKTRQNNEGEYQVYIHSTIYSSATNKIRITY